VQTVTCTGWIKVDDNDPSNPGFVTASGMLTTYAESAPGVDLSGRGGNGRNSTTTPSTTPIVISEGRPF